MPVRIVFCIRFVSRTFDRLRHVAIVHDDKRIANTLFLRAKYVRNCKLVLTQASPTWLLNLGKPRRTGVSTAWQGRWLCRRINRIVTLKRARSLALRSCVPSWFAAPLRELQPFTDRGWENEREKKREKECSILRKLCYAENHKAIYNPARRNADANSTTVSKNCNK